MVNGTEWLVEAWGCDPALLRSRDALAALFDELVADLALRPVAPGQWHVFAGEGGVTGLLMLAESHLCCHSFPEDGLLTLNLYCCRPRPRWPFAERLAERLGATSVEVRSFPRGGRPVDAPGPARTPSPDDAHMAGR